MQNNLMSLYFVGFLGYQSMGVNHKKKSLCAITSMIIAWSRSAEGRSKRRNRSKVSET